MILFLSLGVLAREGSEGVGMGLSMIMRGVGGGVACGGVLGGFFRVVLLYLLVDAVGDHVGGRVVGWGGTFEGGLGLLVGEGGWGLGFLWLIDCCFATVS